VRCDHGIINDEVEAMMRHSAVGEAVRPPVIPDATTLPKPTLASGMVERLLDSCELSAFGVTVDLVLLYVASVAAVLGAGQAHVQVRDWWLAMLYPLIVMFLARFRRWPSPRLEVSVIDTALEVVGGVSFAAMLLIAVDEMVGGGHPIALALRLWLFALVYLGAGRAVLVSWRRHARRTGALARPTLIVGSGSVGEHVAQRLLGRPEYGLLPIGFLDVDWPSSGDSGRFGPLPTLGTTDEIAEVVQRTGARHVIVAFSSQPDQAHVALVRRCEQMGLDVSLVPRLFESINERVALDRVGGMPLLTLRSIDPKGWQFATKHALDRVLATLAMVVGAPIFALIAGAVRASSPGPILFRQRRVGRDGKAFEMYKFRTMVAGCTEEDFLLAEGMAPGGVEGADRRTPVGRWLRSTSLDELPQLFNVLRGDMSLVGPRPERPEFVERFARDVHGYEQRHRVKSGITGWAQVNGLRGRTSIADRVEWDNYYIRNWSLAFDLRILALTLVALFRDRSVVGDEELRVDHGRAPFGPPAD
jgi:exopolysaccharide biosynthesis polyprenyl glycosylphosphotransferase